MTAAVLNYFGGGAENGMGMRLAAVYFTYLDNCQTAMLLEGGEGKS